jgi:hypothetical protein
VNFQDEAFIPESPDQPSVEESQAANDLAGQSGDPKPEEKAGPWKKKRAAKAK